MTVYDVLTIFSLTTTVKLENLWAAMKMDQKVKGEGVV